MLFQFNYQFLSGKRFNITPAVTTPTTNNACQALKSPEVDGPVDHVAFVIHGIGQVLLNSPHIIVPRLTNTHTHTHTHLPNSKQKSLGSSRSICKACLTQQTMLWKKMHHTDKSMFNMSP
ncbi:hypothetical protein PS15m_007873 [Mucor circinelloides]